MVRVSHIYRADFELLTHPAKSVHPARDVYGFAPRHVMPFLRKCGRAVYSHVTADYMPNFIDACHLSRTVTQVFSID